MIQYKKYALALLSAFVLLTTACEDNELVPGGGELVAPAVEIAITDKDGNAVEGAAVELYKTEADYLNHANPVREGVTAANGSVVFPLTGLEPGSYFFDARKGNLRNWDNTIQTPTFVINSGVTLVKSKLGEINLTGIAGPEEISSGASATYNVTPDKKYPGASYVWSVVEGTNFAILPTAKANTITGVTEQSDVEDLVKLQVVATLSGLAPKTMQKDITVLAFCEFDETAWAGVFDTNEPGYGDYQNVAVLHPTLDNAITINNFWDFGGNVTYVFDPATGEVELPEQEVVMGGDTYVVTGSGVYDQCLGSFIVDYVITLDGEVQDENTHTFVKVQ